MEYTVIYTDCTLIGSHMNTLVKMAHVKLKKGESLSAALERRGLETSAIFIFEGRLKSANSW